MKAISAIIVIILILMIVAAIAALAYTFFSSMFASLTETGGISISQVTEKLSSCMKIESIYENKIYLRNCGSGVINNNSLRIYIDDIFYDFDMNPPTINKGELATVKLSFFGMSYGDHFLKITNPSTEITKEIEAYYLINSTLVLGFRFYEDSGIIVHDSSGYENDGTLEGGASWVKGKYGNALEFDGDGDYVGITDSQSLRIKDAIQTEAWIKTSYIGPDNMSIANRFDGDIGEERGWLLFLTEEGKLRFHIGDDLSNWAEATGTSDLRDGNWHHIIGTYNKSIIQVFVDGNLESYIPFSGDIWDGPAGGGQFGFNIGRRCSVCGGSEASFFNGTIDEVRIYRNTTYPFKTLFLRVK